MYAAPGSLEEQEKPHSSSPVETAYSTGETNRICGASICTYDDPSIERIEFDVSRTATTMPVTSAPRDARARKSGVAAG